MNDLARRRRLGHSAITVTALGLGGDALSNGYAPLGYPVPARVVGGDRITSETERRPASLAFLAAAAPLVEAFR